MDDKVIFWDFDGTLSHPNRSFATALRLALTDLGYPVDADADAFLQEAYPWRSPLEDHTAEVGEDWWQALFARLDAYCRRQGVPWQTLPRVHSRVREILTAVDNYGLYEDTLATLKACADKGYVQYLLTNNYPEIVDVAGSLGITSFLKDFFVSSHIGYDKPRRELYQHALTAAGQPAICYMVGDNPVADIAGAKAAGIRTIYVHNGPLPQADISVDCLAAIPALLD